MLEYIVVAIFTLSDGKTFEVDFKEEVLTYDDCRVIVDLINEGHGTDFGRKGDIIKGKNGESYLIDNINYYCLNKEGVK
jgi:hypothetical protein